MTTKRVSVAFLQSHRIQTPCITKLQQPDINGKISLTLQKGQIIHHYAGQHLKLNTYYHTAVTLE